MTIYAMEYRRKDYRIADAFRPDPNYGYRKFTIDSELVGCDDPKELENEARNTAPDGYELFSFKALPHT